jgi:hypothetical protein
MVKHVLEIVAGFNGVQFTIGVSDLVFKKGGFVFKSAFRNDRDIRSRSKP